jgi:hypothetical protein
VRGAQTEFWEPIDVDIRPALEVVGAKLSADASALKFQVCDNAPCGEVRAKATFGGASLPVSLFPPEIPSETLSLPLPKANGLVPGLNPLRLDSANGETVFETTVECWDLFSRCPAAKANVHFEPVDISKHFNDNLALVHTHEYLSPRSPYCSIGPGINLFHQWCDAHDCPCGKLDLGVLAAAAHDGLLQTKPGIPFRAAAEGKNIIFVSQWDNFPKEVQIPVGRSARHAYLLMASTTNPMQSGIVNGRVVFHLSGGKQKTLALINPQNLSWCVDHYPNRCGPLNMIEPSVRLGEHVFATIYSVPLGEAERLDSVGLEAVSNESVIGLMSLTLVPATP